MLQQITLVFSPQRLDYIANVLAQRPYAEAAPVIDDIRAQVQAQQDPGPGPVLVSPPVATPVA